MTVLFHILFLPHPLIVNSDFLDQLEYHLADLLLCRYLTNYKMVSWGGINEKTGVFRFNEAFHVVHRETTSHSYIVHSYTSCNNRCVSCFS